MANVGLVDQDISRTFALLGGSATIGEPAETALAAHDLLLRGLPAATLLYLTSRVAFLNDDKGLDKAVGISVRTLQRRKNDAPDTVLSVEQSNRTWKFAAILGRASEIFGSLQAAENWMNEPAIGLDQRKPIDLLATSVGVEAVTDYLTRIDYGVYV